MESAVIPLVAEHRIEIESLCRRFGVARLELFGSAADGSFDPARSDIDFLVEFQPGRDLGPWLAEYFDFKESLEVLLGRPVDLVMATALKNPWFINEVNRTRTLVHAA